MTSSGWREAAPQGSVALLLSPFVQLCHPLCPHPTLCAQLSTRPCSRELVPPRQQSHSAPSPTGLVPTVTSVAGLLHLVEMASQKGAGQWVQLTGPGDHAGSGWSYLGALCSAPSRLQQVQFQMALPGPSREGATS